MFQYISCYSLSAWKAKGLALHTSFNTSHITLYQTSGTGTDRRKQVSIHLMLLFIGRILRNVTNGTEFQYISCYSLSDYIQNGTTVDQSFNTSHVTLYRRAGSALPGGKESFNTSHVTLYQEFGYDPEWPEMFQYISCYSLSPPLSFFLNTQHVFQYISCYSLSLLQAAPCSPSLGFNTSHVTLYPNYILRII